MSETKFTPGPWIASDVVVSVPGDNPDGRGPETVAVARMPRGTEEAFANAQLIAAAPELLAALELCLKNSELRRASGVESGPMIEREIEAARAAINKAKGG